MTQAMGHQGRHAAQWIGAAVSLSIVFSICAIAVTGYLFTRIDERQTEIRTSVREDAMWAAFQTDREAGRLNEALLTALADPSPANIDAALLRYDLLYSRIELLGEGRFALKFDDADILVAIAEDTLERVRALAPAVDALAVGGPAIPDQLHDLIAGAAAITDVTKDLVVRTNSLLSDARVAERDGVAGLYRQLGIGVLSLIALFVVIVSLQSVQLWLNARARRELLRLSAENARGKRDAEAANRAKTMFLASMSHEIRTPLNGIIATTFVLMDTTLTEAQRRSVQIIQQSGDLLLDVISDILDFSKMESGNVTFERQEFALPVLVQSIREMMAHRAESEGLAFTIDAPAVNLVADAAHLRQVVVNLVGNAIKFTTEGEIAVTLSIVEGSRLVCAVRDTGIGIKSTDIGLLFQDFSQVDNSASRRYGGTGLGLAICKRLVEGMGGTIHVESAFGAGSTFRFEVPVQRVAPFELTDMAVAPSDDADLPRVAADVLLAEDVKINQEVVTALLSNLGATVTTVGDGASAVAALAAGSFDLVLMDIQMPGMSGLEATRAARAAGASVPIVGLTANASTEDRAACLAAGMNDFVTKPVTKQKLATLVRRYGRPVAGVPAAIGGADPSEDVAGLDEDQIAGMAESLGPETLSRLLADLATSGATLVSDAVAAATRGDTKGCDHALHSLKGAALTLGLSRLGAAADALRQGADATAIAALEGHLQADIAAATATLRTKAA